jgi:hypothetical protein
VNYKENHKSITLMDGISLSIQASSGHYSTPRDNEGPYTKVEVGFVQDIDGDMIYPEGWSEWQDGDCPVWGFVPVEIVNAFILKHGGISIGDLL